MSPECDERVFSVLHRGSPLGCRAAFRGEQSLKKEIARVVLQSRGWTSLPPAPEAIACLLVLTYVLEGRPVRRPCEHSTDVFISRLPAPALPPLRRPQSPVSCLPSRSHGGRGTSFTCVFVEASAYTDPCIRAHTQTCVCSEQEWSRAPPCGSAHPAGFSLEF